MSDDLTQIKGIGPVRAADLAAQGIETFAALAVADADFLATTMEVSPALIADWQARALMQIQDAALAATGIDAAAGEDETVYEHFLTGKVRR